MAGVTWREEQARRGQLQTAVRVMRCLAGLGEGWVRLSREELGGVVEGKPSRATLTRNMEVAEGLGWVEVDRGQRPYRYRITALGRAAAEQPEVPVAVKERMRKPGQLLPWLLGRVREALGEVGVGSTVEWPQKRLAAEWGMDQGQVRWAVGVLEQASVLSWVRRQRAGGSGGGSLSGVLKVERAWTVEEVMAGLPLPEARAGVLLAWLRGEADETGLVRGATYQRMGVVVGVPNAMVGLELHRLVSRGELVIVKRGTQRGGGVYRVLPAAPDDVEDPGAFASRVELLARNIQVGLEQVGLALGELVGMVREAGG